MKINFTIDKDYDIEYFVSLLRNQHWESRVEGSGISYDLAKKIHVAQSPEEINAARIELNQIADKEYKRLFPYINRSKELYQESWDPIIDEFSGTISHIMWPWFYEEYQCTITHFNRGLSSWNGNRIGRTWKENHFLQRRITAHEIILAHYFSIHRNIYPNSGLSDRQIWALAEVAAWSVTGLEKEVKKLWPWDTRGYYTDHNYPELVDLQLKLKEPFIDRQNFKDYIQVGIEAVRSYPVNL